MEKSDQEIIFSKSVKSGKRIYYLDVKRNRKNDFFIAITESKKVVTNSGEMPQVTFEKHKLFLYKEDMENFQNGLFEVISFINNNSEDEIEKAEAIDIKFHDFE
ncbi:MAG: DUF3276 family protein [Bacteroidales bacterium]